MSTFSPISPILFRSEMTIFEEISADPDGNLVFIGCGLQYQKQPIDKTCRTLVVYNRKRAQLEEWNVSQLNYENRILFAFQIDENVIFLSYFQPYNRIVYCTGTIVHGGKLREQPELKDLKEIHSLRNDPNCLTVGTTSTSKGKVYMFRQYQEVITYHELYSFDCFTNTYHCYPFDTLPPGVIHLLPIGNQPQLFVYSDEFAWKFAALINVPIGNAGMKRLETTNCEQLEKCTAIEFQLVSSQIYFLCWCEEESTMFLGQLHNYSLVSLRVIQGHEEIFKFCPSAKSNGFYGLRHRNGYDLLECRATFPTLEQLAYETVRQHDWLHFVSLAVRKKYVI